MLLEVERKFCSIAVSNLLHQTGIPAFNSVVHAGHKSLHDVYYDDASFLSSKGVWVRQRNGHWQAKIHQGGNYTNSKFEELYGPRQISNYLASLPGYNKDVRGENFGLSQMAAFTTMRESWVANNEFTIMQDVTDFGHTVGEVELVCEVKYDGPAVQLYKDMRMSEMQVRINLFMKKYGWAWTPGEPKGKLTAYFEKFGK